MILEKINLNIDQNNWGVFTTKEKTKRIVDYDAIDGVNHTLESSVPTEPQENGALYAYDKVTAPREVTVTLLFNGDYKTQQNALSQLEQATRGVDKYVVVTPTSVYEDMTITGMTTVRTSSQGTNMLSVDLSLKEVRAYTVNLEAKDGTLTPKNPASAKQKKLGTSLADSLSNLTATAQSKAKEGIASAKEAVSGFSSLKFW